MRLTFLTFLIIILHHLAFSLDQTCPNPRTDPSAIRDANRCLPFLQTNPSLFSTCKTKICYLFLQEAPFIILPREFGNTPTNPAFYKPFPCGRPQHLHPSLTGVAFSLHNRTSSADELCVWAGPAEECTFNSMVDLIDLAADEGYNFAITGILLQMPDRQCRHSPSAPIIDDAMVVIGRRNESPVSVSASAAWKQLTGPFDLWVWLLFVAVLSLHLLVGYVIARRFPGYSMRPVTTTFRVFTGDLSDSGSDGRKLQPGYVNASRLFRISLVLFLALFVMLYELAAVNFLFQQRTQAIGKSVKSLSIEELRKYAVLKNSALERVWNATVNPTGNKYDTSKENDIPWSRCMSAKECMEWIADDRTQSTFSVTFEIVGQYLMRLETQCGADKLTVYSTQDILYHFSGNWLYNRNVDPEKRKRIDTELTRLRITGTIRELIEEQIGNKGACAAGNEVQITLFIGLLPISVFVLLPLLCAVFSLYLGDHRDNEDDDDGDHHHLSGDDHDVLHDEVKKV